MPRNPLTDRAAVDAAMNEYDALTGDVFLAKYGYARALSYLVQRDGRLYDSKAIYGVAYGKQYPAEGPLQSGDFSGGAGIASILKDLGFTVYDGGGQHAFDADAALGIIRETYGPELSSTKKLAFWKTDAGRDLALQLGQGSARLWLSSNPDVEGLEVSPYGPDDPRISNLAAHAPQLAEPNAAWLVTIPSETRLRQVLDWYRSGQQAALDATALSAMKATFLRAMPSFKTFPESGDAFETDERASKEDLVGRFQDYVVPLVSIKGTSDPEGAIALCNAYHQILSEPSPELEQRQNLVSWQLVDRLGPTDESQLTAIGNALNALLSGDEPSEHRLEQFIATVGELFRRVGASGPLGKARVLGSAALMLNDPNNFLIIRTGLFQKIFEALRNRKFPPYTDEPARIRASMELVIELHGVFENWGWAPRDFIDALCFMEVCARATEPQQNARRFADSLEAALEEFSELRNRPFEKNETLWAPWMRQKVH